MRTRTVLAFGCWATFACCGVASAQDSQIVTENGVQFRVTKTIVNRSIPSTEYQTREQKVYQPQTTTEYQTYQQMYVTPVTEYRLVSRMHGQWNPFGQPYWTHNYEPVTRWEARPGTVQIPTARTAWVETTQTSTVPVTTYRTVPEEYTSKVALSAPPATATGSVIATRPASPISQRMESDPPRYGTPIQR